MFAEIKLLLINQIDSLCELLELYGFENINYRHSEIRFARDADGGQNISIKLENNDALMVHDFVKSIHTDIFAYIMQEKGATLRDILREVKRLLKLEDNWTPAKRVQLFGGIYNQIATKENIDEIKVYDEKILDEYSKDFNEKFLQDGISLESQMFWGDRFDTKSNRIIIPVYDELSRLVGVKGRYNGPTSETDMKYLYLYPCQMSKHLYGYCQNYQHLFGEDVVITEAEKSCQQAYSFGVRNVVALGSNNVSDAQAKLIMQLNPKRIILALDEGLDMDQIKKCAINLREHVGMSEAKVLYWDSTTDIDIPQKASPTDMGKDKYIEIINTQLKEVE